MTEAIRVPEIGENVASGVVVAVHIKVDQVIAVDDTVIELETDKALVEIPSTLTGRVAEVLAEAGAQMNVGDVIARVDTGSAAKSASAVESPASTGDTGRREAAEAEQTAASAAPVPVEDATEWTPSTVSTEDDSSDMVPPRRPPAAAAPSIRRLARELGVDIHAIRGTGPGGRISEPDVKRHVRQQLTGPSYPAAGEPASAPPMPDFSKWGAVETEAMETVRRLTAMTTSVAWSTIPHVTQYDEADVTDVEAFIAGHARRAEQAGVRLTLTAVLTRICAEALKRFPRFNASIDVAGNRIIYKRYVHIGIAVDTPRGLLVPVIRDADRRRIMDLAGAIGDLAQRARNRKIKPDEMEGGTFTLSNQGGIGGVGFTPIVLWPQVAILGVSRSTVRPVYRNDGFEPRTMLPLALSYDHRIIDGAEAARFLRWICDGLKQPLTLLLD